MFKFFNIYFINKLLKIFTFNNLKNAVHAVKFTQLQKLFQNFGQGLNIQQNYSINIENVRLKFIKNFLKQLKTYGRILKKLKQLY